MEEKGIRGIENGNLYCGVGFVSIPELVDPDVYKEDCYRSGRITIYGGEGHSFFYNILIDKETLQEIEFPEKQGEFGSPVLWINIPKHNEPVIICCLKYDEFNYNFEEFSKKITRTYKENISEFYINAKEGRMRISMNSQNRNSDFEININSKSGKSKFLIKVVGETIIHSTSDIKFISEKSVNLAVSNSKGIVVSKLTLSNVDGASRMDYADEYENKIIFEKDKINIRADKSSKVDVGNGKEPVVLAQTLKTLLDEYDDALSKLTVPTAFGPSGTRINDAEFRTVRAKFEQFFSKILNSD